MKKLLLLTFVFGVVVSCNDYEDDFANLNDKLNGISSQLDGIETAVEGIATIQLELLNINSAIEAVSSAIADLPTVADIANLESLINDAIQDIADLDASLAAKLTSLEGLINNGFSAVDVYLATIDGNLTDAQQEIANVLAELGDIDVELDAIDADNQAILLQLASMLTAMNDGFDDLSAENQQILLEVAAIQSDLSETLIQISALNALVTQIQSTIDTNDADVDAQLEAITDLIELLQADLTVLLESTTTVYNDNLFITNDAQLEYAMSLDDKVMVINGDVTIDTNFATGVNTKLANIDSVMTKMQIITKNVDITSTANLLADKLRSVGGNYKVAGSDIQDTSLETIAGNATYIYVSDSYAESNLVNVGGNLVITDNGSATVDFSSLVTLSGNFTINAGAGAAGELTDTDTVNLSSAINDAKLTDPLVITLTADKTNAFSVTTSTSYTVAGDTFDVVNVTLKGVIVSSTLEDVTGNVSVTADGLLTFAANNVGAAGDEVSVSLTSDGQDIDLNDVVASTFSLIDTGSANDQSTDFDYATMSATSFTYLSDTLNAAAADTNNNFDGGDWTVGTTTMSSLRNVNFTNSDAGCVNSSIAGDVSITTTGQGAGIVLTIGDMTGDLTLSSGHKVDVISTVSETTPATVNITGDVDVVAGTNANGGSNSNFNMIVKDCSVPATPANPTAGQYSGSVSGDVSFVSTTATPGDVTLRFSDVSGNLTAGSTKSVIFGGTSPTIEGDFTITAAAAGSAVTFNTATTVGGAISVDVDGTFNGTNFNASATRSGDMSIDAAEGISLPEFTSLGSSSDGTNATTYSTTLLSDGNIDVSTVTTISHDTNMTTTAGTIDMSSVATATGVVVAEAGSGAVDASSLATHDGTQLTLSAATGTVDATALVSSTGNIAINGLLVDTLNGNLPVLESFSNLSVWTEDVENMPSYVDGTNVTITLTDATTFSTTSITIADVTAPVLTSLILSAQATNFDLVSGDFTATGLSSIDITGAATLDTMTFTDVDSVTTLTTAGAVDTFVVSGMDGLTAINAGHTQGDEPVGSKLHILNNTALTSYTSNSNSMHEIRIEGNTALTALDLSSYLTGGAIADINTTANDLATVDFVLRVTGNGITGTFAQKDNVGNDTALDSAELSEVKLIALHLLSFTQAASVVVEADFVGLTSDVNAVDQYNSDTDFTDGINNEAEFTLLND